MGEFNLYLITTTARQFSFIGKHLPERERPNWHYYQDKDGGILHFRKEHMICVIESDVPDEKE